MEDNRRLFLIVLDSVGIGEAPDAAQFGDEGSNTVRAAVEAGADLPNLRRLGLFNIDGMDWTEPEAAPIGAFGRMREASMGRSPVLYRRSPCPPSRTASRRRSSGTSRSSPVGR